MRILQINLNNSSRAQDLMLQHMRDNGMDVALVFEPNKIPEGKWLGEMCGVAATLSCMQEWVHRGHEELTYQATQLITGPGCFKGYIHRIGKTDNGKCSLRK